MDQIRLKVTSAQKRILKSQTRGNIFVGGIGSGKTLTLSRLHIRNALCGRSQCCVSFDYPNVRDAIVPTCNDELDRWTLTRDLDYKFVETHFTYFFDSCPIALRTGSAPSRLRGPNWHDFSIDEGREFPGREKSNKDHAFDIMLGRIRNSDDGQWYISSTTKGKDWVYQLYEHLFDEVMTHGWATDGDITVVRQRTQDNPFIPREWINDIRRNYTSALARQELDAEIIELGAGIINPQWFILRDDVPPKPPGFGVRFWDLAVSLKESADCTASVLASNADGKYMLHDVTNDRLEYPDLRRKIISTAISDGHKVHVCVESTGTQLGFVQDLQRTPELSSYVVRGVSPRGDKLNRAVPWMARAEGGQVYLRRAPWNKMFLDQCNSFSADNTHDHDDMIDANSGAYFVLCSHGVQGITNTMLNLD